ncbi:NTP transferase domain-containing protein [Candidatus Woesearchaeota archaeon]|nr:NTP transferase domain-containing protein [Candidatus Woesearchaeota archaeon]
MLGVVLAGGSGTRLWPNTMVLNKHIVRVGKLPMIEYPIYSLVRAGIKDIAIVSGGEHFEQIERYLGNGSERGVHFHYENQNRANEKPKGIAHALSLVERLAGKENVFVILGDNIIEDKLDFSEAPKIFLKKVKDPKRFGVAKIDEKKISYIIEKPEEYVSDFAVIGAYVYTSEVFEFIRTLKPSERGELEITDVNNFYLKKGNLSYQKLKGFWSDAGTQNSILRADNLVRKSGLDDQIIGEFPFLDIQN